MIAVSRSSGAPLIHPSKWFDLRFGFDLKEGCGPFPA
jgi:hypothetical protein